MLCPGCYYLFVPKDFQTSSSSTLLFDNLFIRREFSVEMQRRCYLLLSIRTTNKMAAIPDKSFVVWDKATTNNELREKKRKKSYQTDLKSENFKKGAICDLFNRISTLVDLIKDCQSLEERRPGNNVKLNFFTASSTR